jgi:thioredoxin 1
MTQARFSLALSAAVAALWTTPSSAAETVEFTREAFEAAQAAGRAVVVDVAAWWCPVCIVQGRHVATVVSAPEFDKVVVMRLGWGSQEAEWKRFNVTQRGTLIAFRGKEERARLVFETDTDKIRGVVQAAVADTK